MELGFIGIHEGGQYIRARVCERFRAGLDQTSVSGSRRTDASV
jgi:hypothetical protein